MRFTGPSRHWEGRIRHFEGALKRIFTEPYDVRAAIVLELAKLKRGWNTPSAFILKRRESFSNPPRKRGGFPSTLPQLFKGLWVLNASPSPFRPQRCGHPLFPSLLAKKGRDVWRALVSVLTETRKATAMFKSRVFLTRRSLEIMLLGSHARRINMPVSNATKHEAQRIYPAAREGGTVGRSSSFAEGAWRKSKGSPLIRVSAFLCCYLRRWKHCSWWSSGDRVFSECSDMRYLI